MNVEAVYRTAPATPGLLISKGITVKYTHSFKVILKELSLSIPSFIMIYCPVVPACSKTEHIIMNAVYCTYDIIYLATEH